LPEQWDAAKQLNIQKRQKAVGAQSRPDYDSIVSPRGRGPQEYE
jgi:hypothetical protein